ncbi:phloem protein 2-A1 [Prunus dulcis]|uniref:Phloem protein 2-A1 n=1 Tax=Prunus dulcis TaxID=3755 RepID=A0A4Y1RBE3_PRUDU|nr:phloem protein 2-A1 [Prunus dulcis]
MKASPEKPGDMEFSMYKYDSGKWKGGLVIKGHWMEECIKEMGTSWSQDEANNSQSQPSEQPSNNKAVEKETEAKAAPSGSKPMAVEKTAPDHQAKLSANNSNHEITVVKEVKEMEKKTATQQVKQQLPHNYEAIRYWVDKKSNNCFMVYARDLLITWAEDNRYWLWPSLQETSGVVVDAAELINVCWLEVHGKFETSKLSPGTLYEVVFVVKLKASGYGWDVPVNVRLTLPDDSIQWHKVNLMEIPREQWIEISVGEFRASPEKPGDMEFSMYEYDGGKWKRGLVIKGVTIRPKN